MRRERWGHAGSLEAVILGGGLGEVHALPHGGSTLGYPMADGRPLLTHMLRSLRANGVREAAVTLPPPMERTTASWVPSDEIDGLRVHCAVDDGLSGTGGVLTHLRGIIRSSPFVVVAGPLWLRGIDLTPIWTSHKRSGAAATVVVTKGRNRRETLEGVEVGPDGSVGRWHVRHHSRERRRSEQPVGLYVFDRQVLELIDPDGYSDVNEQVLPLLVDLGMRVQAYRLEQPIEKVESLDAYWRVNRDILLEDVEATTVQTSDRPRGVFIGRDSQVSPDAYLLGPVVIGDNCRISEGAQIVGPTVICDDSRIGRNALVRESFVWKGSRVGDGSSVTYSLITEGCNVPDGKSVHNSVLVGADARAGSSFVGVAKAGPAVLFNERGGRLSRGIVARAKRRGYRIVKRSLDLAASIAGLTILSPLFAVLGVCIKLDSPGPVFFVQPRCGRDGKDFGMVKFRTMVIDAVERQDEFRELNEADGPMFKISADPRITRLGKFLRSTSLDELPQLWNVLRGDMSLVGPRPLCMEEMTWSPKWRHLRLTVKPGVTGPWQVYARNEPGFDCWIEHDIDYVLNRSLRLDLRLLLETIRALVGARRGV